VYCVQADACTAAILRRQISRFQQVHAGHIQQRQQGKGSFERAVDGARLGYQNLEADTNRL